MSYLPAVTAFLNFFVIQNDKQVFYVSVAQPKLFAAAAALTLAKAIAHLSHLALFNFPEQLSVNFFEQEEETPRSE